MGSHVSQAGLELPVYASTMIQSAEIYRNVLPCQANVVQGIIARTSRMLGSAAN